MHKCTALIDSLRPAMESNRSQAVSRTDPRDERAPFKRNRNGSPLSRGYKSRRMKKSSPSARPAAHVQVSPYEAIYKPRGLGSIRIRFSINRLYLSPQRRRTRESNPRAEGFG
jgi:hypothetical protein